MVFVLMILTWIIFTGGAVNRTYRSVKMRPHIQYQTEINNKIHEENHQKVSNESKNETYIKIEGDNNNIGDIMSDLKNDVSTTQANTSKKALMNNVEQGNKREDIFGSATKPVSKQRKIISQMTRDEK